MVIVLSKDIKCLHYVAYISTRLQEGMFDKTSLMKDVWHRFKVQSLFFQQDEQPWVRISANVYNTIEDYEKLANAILILKAEETH